MTERDVIEVNGHDDQDSKLPVSIRALLESYGDPIDMASPVVVRQSPYDTQSEIAAVLKVMIDAGYPHEQVKDIIAILVKKSSDNHLTSSDNMGGDALTRKRERDREYQRKYRLKVKKTSDVSDDAKSEVSIRDSKDTIDKKESKEVRGSGIRARGHRLPDDWQPSSKHFDEGLRLGYSRESVISQAEDMRLWARANEHRAVARKLNWEATFSGWLRRNRKPNDGRRSAIAAADRIIDQFGGASAAAAYVPGSHGPTFSLDYEKSPSNSKRLPKG